MGAERDIVGLWLSPGEAAENPLPSDLLGKNLCKSANVKQAELAEQARRLSVAHPVGV